MATENEKLIQYSEAQRRLGFRRRTFFNRLRETGIKVYIDGNDRRQRLIHIDDLPKLVETDPEVRDEAGFR